jgi:hypothetical protein
MKAKACDKESVEEVMSRVSHADLLYHYFGIASLPTVINSPLRRDEHPSLYIYSPDGIKVLYKDCATGDSGDIYTLLMKKEGLSFGQLLRRIASEKVFSKGNFDACSPKRAIKKTFRELRVAVREWRDYDVNYWQSYGISLNWLKYAEVYPISHKIVYKDNNRYVIHAVKYAYVFVERKEGNISLKIYQPFAEKRYKWDNSNDSSVVGLWTKIPEYGDKVVICSSLKDALCLWSNTGIPSIYVQSETIGLSSTAQEVLKKRFKEIFVLFDNDKAGLKDGKNFSEMTGFTNLVLPLFSEGKDISDFFKAYGKEKFVNMIKGLFNGK